MRFCHFNFYDIIINMKRNILVTGGAGFIGSHIADRLIKEGHKVAIVDNLSTGDKKNLNLRANFYKIDILDPEISEIFKAEKPKVVFHCAAQINLRESVENPIRDAKINILGSLNIIKNFVSINSTPKPQKNLKFVFTSTGGAMYGESPIIPTPETSPAVPLSPYGVAKLATEKYLNYYHKISGLPFISLRLANVYGPRQNPEGEAGVVAIFCQKMLTGEQPVIYGKGAQTRDFVYVDDVVEANILAMKSKKNGVYNVGTGKETNVNVIFKKIRNLINADCQEVHKPGKPGEQERSCLDYSKIEREFSWRPEHDLALGLEKTVEWFKSQKR